MPAMIAQHSGDPDKQYRGAIEDFNNALRPNAAEAYVSRGGGGHCTI